MRLMLPLCLLYGVGRTGSKVMVFDGDLQPPADPVQAEGKAGAQLRGVVVPRLRSALSASVSIGSVPLSADFTR
jgi:hypothetical protein